MKSLYFEVNSKILILWHVFDESVEIFDEIFTFTFFTNLIFKETYRIQSCVKKFFFYFVFIFSAFDGTEDKMFKYLFGLIKLFR